MSYCSAVRGIVYTPFRRVQQGAAMNHSRAACWWTLQDAGSGVEHMLFRTLWFMGVEFESASVLADADLWQAYEFVE